MEFNEHPYIHADKNKRITWNFSEEQNMYMVLKYLPIKYLQIIKYKSIISHLRNIADISHRVIKVNIQMCCFYPRWITWI